MKNKQRHALPTHENSIADHRPGVRGQMEAALTGLPEVQGLMMDNGMLVERMVETLYHHNSGNRFLEMWVQESWELLGLMDSFSQSSLIYGDEEAQVFCPWTLF